MKFKAILPKAVNKSAAESILRSEMEKFKPILVADFAQTTSSWEGEKPSFVPKTYISPAEIKIVVAVIGSKLAKNKWMWLDEGTRPHIIAARIAPRLAFFASGFQPKTYPNKLWTLPGSKANKDFRRPLSVKHPGTKARNWSKLIKERNERAFARWTEAATYAALKATGHLFINPRG